MNDNDHPNAPTPATRLPERRFLAADETTFIARIDERDLSTMRSLSRHGRTQPITIVCCPSYLHRPQESDHHTSAHKRPASASQDTA